MNKKKFLAIFFVIAILAVMTPVLAANDEVTLVTPADSVYIKGTAYNFSATINTNTKINNVTFYYWTSASALKVRICNHTNHSSGLAATSFSCEYDVDTNIADASLTFGAIACEGDTQVTGDNSTTVTVDDTNPLISMTVDRSQVLERTKQRISVTHSDATAGVNKTIISLTTPKGTKTNWTYTTNFEITGDDLKETGEYTVYFYATDKAGNQQSTSDTFDVYSGTAGGEYEPPIADDEGTNWFPFLAVLALIIIVAILLGKKKKR